MRSTGSCSRLVPWMPTRLENAFDSFARIPAADQLAWVEGYLEAFAVQRVLTPRVEYP